MKVPSVRKRCQNVAVRGGAGRTSASTGRASHSGRRPMRTHRQRAATSAAALFARRRRRRGVRGSKDARPSATPPPADATADGATAPAATSTPTPAPPDPNLGDRLRGSGRVRGGGRRLRSYRRAHERRRAAGGAACAGATAVPRRALRRCARGARRVPRRCRSGGRCERGAIPALASALDDLGETQGALDSYERYITAGGAAGRLRARRAGETAGAARTQRGRRDRRGVGARKQPAAGVQGVVRAEHGQGIRAGEGRRGRAGVVRTREDDRWRRRRVRISADRRHQEAAGRRDGPGEYTQAVLSYPSSGVAPDLLDELDAGRHRRGDYARGVVEYRAFRNADARGVGARSGKRRQRGGGDVLPGRTR